MKTYVLVETPEPHFEEREFTWPEKYLIKLRQRHGSEFREGPSYRRNVEHLPKEKDQSKEDWRERKGFKKNFRKRCRGCCSSRKTWVKKHSNHKHRQAERAAIHNGQWDSLHIKTPKNIFDPWMWD